jgi:D-alanyl-D-alanine carboxypeptidase
VFRGQQSWLTGRRDESKLQPESPTSRRAEALTAGHRFRIGSVTKVFVAALVLGLVADGLLELDASAQPFVADVTIRQLLNHTSGLDDFDFGPELWDSYRRDSAQRWELEASDELWLVLEKPRLFPPGEGWAYHGSNYIALRLVVEQAIGTSLRDALRERVFEPLGLEQTDLVEESLRGGCAHGYLAADNPIFPGRCGPVDVTELDLPFYRAGGGIVSTPGEVAALLRGVLGGGFLPDKVRAEMLDTVESDWEETDRYGLGIGEITSVMGGPRASCGGAWGHLGFSLGYVAVALSSEDAARQVVICANGHPAEADTAAFLDAAGRLAWDLYCA